MEKSDQFVVVLCLSGQEQPFYDANFYSTHPENGLDIEFLRPPADENLPWIREPRGHFEPGQYQGVWYAVKQGPDESSE